MVDLLSCRLTVCGIAELPTFADQHVTHVLTLLDPLTADPPAFQQFPSHTRRSLQFHDVIAEYPGYQAPQSADVAQVLAFGAALQPPADGVTHMLVHCHMGISRSTAAMAMLLAQRAPGSEELAFLRLFEIRPRAWPNSRMVALADDLLGRDGALVAALHRHQRRILRHHPDIADLVRNVGRGHELPAD